MPEKKGIRVERGWAGEAGTGGREGLKGEGLDGEGKMEGSDITYI